MKTFVCLLIFALSHSATQAADLRLPAILGDHMVLQQKQANPIWGWDTPGAEVTVSFAGQTHSATTGSDRHWRVTLDPMAANSTPQTLTVTGSTTREIRDVLVGEVWMCSGQSNMAFALQRDWNGDLEAAASRHPNLRLIKVPQVGTQDAQEDFIGSWKASTVETARSFSAIGLLFGRYLHEILEVPVGLIDNAWGGSAAEAWVRRKSLEEDPRFAVLMRGAVAREAGLQSEKASANHEAALAKWEKDAALAKAEGKPVRRVPTSPQQWLSGNARPGNIFNGMLNPMRGYGLKGVIWYQGEANTSRAQEYADLFPFLIAQWRKEWGQGDFPFYWVQLADHRPEKTTPEESTWAELREAQTKTLRLPQTGQAVIIDLGEGRDIHPRNKHDAAARLVRWALAKDYGMAMPHRSPEFKSIEVHGRKAVVTIECFGSSLYSLDVADARGFAICGPDRIWHWAKGAIAGKDRVEVTSEQVEQPVAVRYAWADNPVCNLFSKDGLPVTPFRTDDFPLVTAPK